MRHSKLWKNGQCSTCNFNFLTCRSKIYTYSRDNCSSYAPDDVCHEVHHTRKKTLRSVRKTNEVELLILRSGIKARDIKNICSHHEQELLIKFSALRKKCCDPLNRHPEKTCTKSLRIVNMDTYKGIVNPPKALVP